MILVSGTAQRPWSSMGALFDAAITYFVALWISQLIGVGVPDAMYYRIFDPLLPEEIEWAKYVTAGTIWFCAMLWMLLAEAQSRNVLGQLLSFPPLDTFSKKVLIQSLALFLLLIAFSVTIAFLYPQQFHQDDEVWRYLLSSSFKWLAIFNLLLLGPLFEEVMFRGLLFPTISESFLGPIGSAILTSTIWSAIHFYSMPVSICVFLSGLVMCYLRRTSGSLWPSLILHSAFNLLMTLQFVYLNSQAGG